MERRPLVAAEVLIKQQKQALAISGAAAISKAVEKSVSQELPIVVQNLGKALSRRALPDSQLLEVNKRIAKSAQEAVFGGYRSRLPRRGFGGDSELSGTLGQALADPGMINGTSARVISFVNPRVLDQEAVHWYRVNYGAIGPKYARAGGHEPATYTVSVGGRPFVTLRDTHRPAALSYLPAAFYWNGATMIVTRGPATPRGKGSRAARFLDLGLEQVAKSFPVEYDHLFRRFVQTAAGKARLERSEINTNVDIRVQSYGYTVSVS